MQEAAFPSSSAFSADARQAKATPISMAVLAGIVRAGDVVLLMLAGAISIRIVTALYGGRPDGTILLAAIAGTLTAGASLAREQAYTQPALLSAATQLRLSIKPLLLATFVMIACLFVLNQRQLPDRTWPLAWIVTAALLLAAGRVPLAMQLRRWTAGGRLARRVAVVGVSDFSREFIHRLQEEPNAFEVVGLYDDRHSRVETSQLGVKVRGSVADLLERSRMERIDVIAIALPLTAPDRIRLIMEQLRSTVADVVLTTGLAGLRYSRSQFASIGSNPVVSIQEAPLKDWHALEKAAFDYALGAVALVLLSPLLLLTALAIKLDSPGPVLFRQPRMGFNNRLFLCYKFRSMHHGMADLLADRQTTRGDPRITRVGRIIRKLSIDELPQLFNVLNGSMSLVGPRPHAPNTKAADKLFTDVVQQYALRHRVKPGITGWAQVNGWRGETTTVDQIEQRVACDLFYIEHWSMRFDLRILVMTVLREIKSRHAF